VDWHLGKRTLLFILELKVVGWKCLTNILLRLWTSCLINLVGQEIFLVHFHPVAFIDRTCQYGLLVLKVFLTLYFKVENIMIWLHHIATEILHLGSSLLLLQVSGHP
jgi:hypothetical protein